MPDILRGNYEVKDAPRADVEVRADDLTEQFEQATLAKVGGSICFVMKTDSFLWTGDTQAER